MQTILCIFKIIVSDMSFREIVRDHVSKCLMTKFLALALSCTRMYAFRVASSPFAYAISLIDTHRRFTFLVCHSFLTLFYLRTHVK